MSVRTQDRETMRRAGVHVLGNISKGWTVACSSCSWPRDGRRFATESGAVNSLAEHMMQIHKVKLTLRPETKES